MNLKQKLGEVPHIVSQTITEDVVRGIVFFIAISGLTTQVVQGRSPDPYLASLVTLIAGYYFGRGVTNGKHSGASHTHKRKDDG